jgi:hypothetical protein
MSEAGPRPDSDLSGGAARPRKGYPLRLNAEIHAALERWAADELRSLNSQIEFLLRKALADAGRLKKD